MIVRRLPFLVLSIAVVLICFYLLAVKKRVLNDLNMRSTQVDNTSSVLQTISLGEEQAHVNTRHDTFPPRYSDVDHPPPYSLVREPSLRCPHIPAQTASRKIGYHRIFKYKFISLFFIFMQFDPKLTGVWPGGPPPVDELYAITLPLEPHHWMDPAPPSSPSTPNH